jgi:hypothetical protein
VPGLSFPILALVASAILFAPLASWLALQRARSWALWFGFGVVLGPIAVLLLALAPPGRCPACGTQSIGWPGSCSNCGLSFTSTGTPATTAAHVPTPVAAGAMAEQASTSIAESPERASAGRRPAGSTTSASARRSRALKAAPVEPAISMIDPDSRPIAPVPVLAGRAGEVEVPGHLPATALGRRATAVADTSPPPVPPRASSTELAILGSGVFVGGTVSLQIGSRYLLARVGSELHILGPIHISPAAVAARVPLSKIEPTVVSDRLLLSATRRSRGPELAFSSLLLERDVELARDLRVARRTKAVSA